MINEKLPTVTYSVLGTNLGETRLRSNAGKLFSPGKVLLV